MKGVLLFVCLLLVVAVSGDSSGYVYQCDNNIDVVQQFLKDLAKYLPNLQTSANNTTMCWKDTQVRGVGTPIDSCRPGEEKNGWLCYPNCKSGFYGVGPVCWAYCRPGFRDDGALCSKPGSITSADNSQCPWYDKCGLVTAKGCSKCPPNTINDGCTCRVDPVVYAKDSYGRGAGTPLTCSADKEYDAGLCYVRCPAGFRGIGPVCWGICPASIPEEQGALCCKTAGECSEKVAELARSVIAAIAAGIEAGQNPQKIMDAIKAAIEALLGFVLPICRGL